MSGLRSETYIKGKQATPLAVDAAFSFEDSIRHSIEIERHMEVLDMGPTDAMSEEMRERAYNAYFGASPLSSPSPSPPPSRPASPVRKRRVSSEVSSPRASGTPFYPHEPSGDSKTRESKKQRRFCPQPHQPEHLPSPPAHQPMSTRIKTSNFTSTANASPKPPPTPHHSKVEVPADQLRPITPPLEAASATSAPGDRPGAPGDARPKGGPVNGNSKTRRRKAQSHRRTALAERNKRSEEPYSSRETRPATVAKHIAPAETIKTEYDCASIPSASTGFVALPDVSSRVFTLDELLARGFTLVKVRDKKSRAIVDCNDLVIAVIVNQPDDENWASAVRSAFEELQTSKSFCKFPKKSTKHRRGRFPALNVGISFGGGQPRPGNLFHRPPNAKELECLRSLPAFKRIASFASGAFAAWAPKLHTYYNEHLEALLAHDPSLRRNFKKSTWAAAAYNFGPSVVTAKHCDFANLPFGLCGITALGNYDPTRGGHAVLWELKLVIEFPPGCTILIPSASISHSNTPIGKGETRASFTQYTAGGIFRWVDHGFQKEGEFDRGLTDDQRADVLEENEARCKLGLSLFSTMDELRAR